MATGPYRPTKTCGRCKTTFPTRYEWKHHTRLDCDDRIMVDMRRMQGETMESLWRKAFSDTFATRPVPEPRTLTLELFQEMKRRLGPPPPRYTFKSLVPPLIPEGEVWVLGSPATIANLGRITNVGKEPTNDGKHPSGDPGQPADAGAGPAADAGPGDPRTPGD